MICASLFLNISAFWNEPLITKRLRQTAMCCGSLHMSWSGWFCIKRLVNGWLCRDSWTSWCWWGSGPLRHDRQSKGSWKKEDLLAINQQSLRAPKDIKNLLWNYETSWTCRDLTEVAIVLILNSWNNRQTTWLIR